MKIGNSGMKWGDIHKKLKVGVALADRQKKSSEVSGFNSSIEKIAYAAARSTGQMSNLGNFGNTGIVAQLQAGELIPDQIFGWNTKTVLAALLLLTLFKIKKLQGAA